MRAAIRVLAYVFKTVTITVIAVLLFVVATGTQEAVTRLSDEVQIEAYCARHVEPLARRLNVTAGPGACTLEYLDDVLGTSDYVIHFNRLNREDRNSVNLVVGPALFRFNPVDGREHLQSMHR